jgi:DNA (cytosine-5)-methyltransferase 1
MNLEHFLILFSGIGGATKGIKEVYPNTEITTVDIDEDVNPMICRDALSFPIDFYQSFDFIWASPPCQAYSISSKASGKNYPDLLQKTYDLLIKVGKPFCIENVVSAKIKQSHTIILNGWNFEDLRDMRRPRKFWTNYYVSKPSIFEKIYPSKRLISGGGGWIRKEDKVIRMSLEEAKFRFGINGTMKQLSQIVLPQYAKYMMEAFHE